MNDVKRTSSPLPAKRGQRKCRSRCHFSEMDRYTPERTYVCGLPKGHNGPHHAFELKEVASWPQKDRT